MQKADENQVRGLTGVGSSGFYCVHKDIMTKYSTEKFPRNSEVI